MKIRNGFVSNSSSSSFIINIGIVENKDKFQKFLREYGVKEGWEFKMFNQSEFLENTDTYPVWGEMDWAGYYGGEEVIKNIFAENSDAIVFVKTGTGPNDDSFFHEDDGWGCDYSKIDIDDFDEVDQKIGNGDNGVKLVEMHYGAGRDG